jgi:CBS-domain-containing membrane protein
VEIKKFKVFTHIIKMIGIETSNTSFYEKIISSIGSIIGIYCSYIITSSALTDPHSHILFTSLGATAVLIFVTPHSALSQPWNIVCGHIFSAVVGYLALLYIPDVILASSLAVGGAIVIMYLTRSIHPPGAATALFIILSGQEHSFNFALIFEVLSFNLVVILISGVIFNNLFYWRRYPAYFYFHSHHSENKSNNLSHEDFSAALIHLDSYIDVSSEELTLIFDLALDNAAQNKNKRKIPVNKNCFYSNGALGKNWSVRKVHDIDDKKVTYQTVVGNTPSVSKNCSIKEFQNWARLEVMAKNNTWVKKGVLLNREGCEST